MSSALPDSTSSLEIMKESIDCFNDSRAKRDDKPSIFALVCEALKTLGSEDKGLSIIAIKKWIVGHYSEFDSASLRSEIKVSITKGLENGIFKRAKHSKASKGTNGYFMLTVNETSLEDSEESDDEEIEFVHKTPKIKTIVQSAHLKKDKKIKAAVSIDEAVMVNLSRSSTLFVSDSSLPLSIENSQIGLVEENNIPKSRNRRHVKIGRSEQKLEFGILPANKSNETNPDSFKIKNTPISMTPMKKKQYSAETPFADTIGSRQDFVIKSVVTPKMSLRMIDRTPFRSADFINRSQIRPGASMSRSNIRAADSINRSQITPADLIRRMQIRAAEASLNMSHIRTPDSTSEFQIRAAASTCKSQIRAADSTCKSRIRAADSTSKSQISTADSIMVAENNATLTPSVKPRTVLDRKEETPIVKSVQAKKSKRPKTQAKGQIKTPVVFKNDTKLNVKQNEVKIGVDVIKPIDEDFEVMDTFNHATPVLRRTRVMGRKRLAIEKHEVLDMDAQMVKLPTEGKLTSVKPKNLKRLKVKIQKKPTDPKIGNDSAISEREDEVLTLHDSVNQIPISQLKGLNIRKEDTGLASDEPEGKMQNKSRSKEAPKFKLFKEHLEIPKPRGRPKNAKSSSAKIVKLKDTGTTPSHPASSMSKPNLRKPKKENILDKETLDDDTVSKIVTKKRRLEVTSKPSAMTKSKTDSGLVVKAAAVKKKQGSKSRRKD